MTGSLRDSLKEVPARSLLLLGWSAVALVLLASVMYGVMPGWRTHRKVAMQLDTLSSYAESDIDLAEQIAIRSRDNETLKQQLLGDTGRLPAKQLQTHVIGKLQAICWQTRMEMLSIKPAAAETRLENLNAMDFELELAGDYFDWFAWLNKLRDDLGFVAVQSYDIKVMNVTDIDPKLGFSLKLAAYRVAEAP